MIWKPMIWRRCIQHVSAAILLLLVALSPATADDIVVPDATPPSSTEYGRPLSPHDCFDKLRDRSAERIVCIFPAYMSEREKEELSKLTRGLVTDARCRVRVDVPRTIVDDAIETPNHTFQSPDLPVTCDVDARDTTYTFDFHFSPQVVFKDGQAVEATPGMSPVEGAPSVLSWLVRSWVNSSNDIEDGFITIVNAYLARHRREHSE